MQKNSTYKKILEPTLYYGDTGIARNSNGLWHIQMGIPLVGHGGNTAAFSSYLLIEPVSKTGIVVMTNQSGEEVYNYELMPIVFGKFEPRYSNGFSPKRENIDGTYQDARTVLKGYMKIYTLITRIKVEEDETGSIDTYIQGKKYKAKPFKPFLYDYDGSLLYFNNSDDKPTILSQAFRDYYRLDKNQVVRESIINYLAIASLIYSVILLIVEFVSFIFTKVKKKVIKKDFLKKYYLLTLTQILFVFVNILIMVSKISNYTVLEDVKVHVYLTFAFMIGILAYAIFLPFAFKKTNANKKTKFKYILTATASFIIVINIYYWELYLLR